MEKIAVGTRFALVDASDLETLSGYVWYVHKGARTCYARGYLRGAGKSRGLIYMHRLLMSAERGQEIDHVNGDGMDNRRSNLRFCTRRENNANRHAVQSKSSPYKGVHFEAWSGKWRAEIMSHGRRYKLGRFTDVKEAKRAYNAKARELFGEFAAF